MKRVLKVIIIIIIAFVIVAAVGIFYLTRGLESGAKVQVGSVNTSSLSDGNYEGTYNEGRWTNKVAVTVKGGKITDIKLIKDVAFSKSEVIDALFKNVIKAQNTTVDAVSGATVTSKAYLKSIENAL